ncbi:MAG: acyltransferase [Saprospiraceae bacterium]|nr:acyltransferase [Saprospiraceae bacterium]
MNFMNWFSIITSPHKAFLVFCAFIIKSGKKGRVLLQRAKYRIPSSAIIGDLTIVGENFSIGDNSYFNSGYISSNINAKVQIGKWCALGHNVTLLAVTHDPGIPTGNENLRPLKMGDVIIEDGVWIGSNVIIVPGVKIGRQAVIGGNSVVTKDIPECTVCSGNPCKVLYSKNETDIKKHSDIIQS